MESMECFFSLKITVNDDSRLLNESPKNQNRLKKQTYGKQYGNIYGEKTCLQNRCPFEAEVLSDDVFLGLSVLPPCRDRGMPAPNLQRRPFAFGVWGRPL